MNFQGISHHLPVALCFQLTGILIRDLPPETTFPSLSSKTAECSREEYDRCKAYILQTMRPNARYLLTDIIHFQMPIS